MVNQLPAVGRIQGLSLVRYESPQDATVKLQYTDHDDGWHETQMSFLDAMYLLNLLKAVQKDTGFEMPDEPYAPQ